MNDDQYRTQAKYGLNLIKQQRLEMCLLYRRIHYGL